jgi:hypothetical protein
MAGGLTASSPWQPTTAISGSSMALGDHFLVLGSLSPNTFCVFSSSVPAFRNWQCPESFKAKLPVSPGNRPLSVARLLPGFFLLDLELFCIINGELPLE